MTYVEREISEQSGAPVEVYEFYAEAFTYRYTSAESDVLLDGNTYTSEPIERTDIALSVEEPRNALTLRMRRNNPIADMFRVSPPDKPIGVIVRRFHRDDTEIAVAWVGRVLNVTWANTTTATVQCEPASVSANRNGLGRYYQIPCPYALFNPNDCKVDRAAFEYPTTVAAVSGLALTTAAKHSTLPYPGGFIEFADGTPPVTERRLIVAVSGLVFTLSRPFSAAMTAGKSVVLLPGCDHTMATCDGVFANRLNYGGFIGMPTKNPFTGAPVY